jgi:hypothetical protein
MSVDKKLYVFLKDYGTIRQWRGDVVFGTPVVLDNQLDHILISQHSTKEIKIPVIDSSGELLIREVSKCGRLHGREFTSDLTQIFVVNATFLGRAGWIHYTEPLCRNKLEVSGILKRLENSDIIKAELFVQDDENEQFDGDIGFHVIISITGHPSDILQVNHVGGSCWFELLLNKELNRKILRVGGKEYSIKSRNWFQPWGWLNSDQKKLRPKLILSCSG